MAHYPARWQNFYLPHKEKILGRVQKCCHSGCVSNEVMEDGANTNDSKRHGLLSLFFFRGMEDYPLLPGERLS